MRDNLVVSAPPHIHRRDESVSKIMWMVVLSLIPAGIAGVVVFGMRAFWVIAIGTVSALIMEAGLNIVTGKRVTVLDGSAFVTGILLAYNLPPGVPLWLPVIGSFFAIAIGKAVFGGLGQNIFNPALAGRVFLMASWPTYMVNFTAPIASGLSYDAVTAATPLALLKEGKLVEQISYLRLFLGNKAGCIGEISIVALILGAVFLLARGYISWHIPLSFIASTGLFMFIFGQKGLFSGDWMFHILSGGLILGAVFMATDYVTSPLTRKGQVIFGLGCGLLTAIIRLWGGYPEGVSYAILIMNGATPIIDRYTKSRIYGTK